MTAKASERTVLSARRIVSLLIAATVAVFLFFVIAEAGHDCSGDHCPICACVAQCEHQLALLGAGGSVAAAVTPCGLWLLLVLAMRAAGRPPPSKTRVTAKVRLDD